MLREAGIGKQGRSRSPAANATALLQVHHIQQLGHSFNESVKATAATQLASPSRLREVYKQFSRTGSLLPPHDRRADWRHPFFSESGPTYEAELLIHRELHDVKINNVFESCSTLVTELKDQLDIIVSKSTVHRWLLALGYQYGKKKFTSQPAGYRNALIRSYIYRYAKALSEQEQGKAVIVYMDESYIFAHHCTDKLWYALSSTTKNEVRGDNRGKRIIIMHAMTKDGLLEVEGVEPSNILTEMYHSCALIFDEVCVDNITPADYHDTINGEKFIGWMQQRLLPTFRAKYGDKMKMYLVLDNAKYHHHRGPDWFSTTNKKRGQLADFLRQCKVKSITLEDGRIIFSTKFSADCRGRNGGGPTLEELKKAVKDYIKGHPEINTTVPQQLMDDVGYELLYTPPYVSELQPIELIWAFTKALVARQSYRTRTLEEATIQTRQAMDEVSAYLCKQVIRHCHDWIHSFMKSEEGGSLRRYLDLSLLMYAINHSITEAEETEDTLNSNPEEEDKENQDPQWNI
jgi:hypothetical protein